MRLKLAVITCAFVLFLAYYSGALFEYGDRSAQRIQRKVALKLVVLTFGAVLWTVHHGVPARYRGHCVRKQEYVR